MARFRSLPPLFLGMALALAAAAIAPAQEAHLQRALDETANPLAPGEFRWYPQISQTGPVVILVSIPDQLVKVYRNGIRIGISTVSTGRPGHDTPTGVFHILEKDKDHVSNLFPGAEMPNMQRLTWTGIALHAGNLPGYPASHGCVRMPLEFSEKLYEITDKGGTVVIADEVSAPREVTHAGLILADSEIAALEQGAAGSASTAELFWQPERAPEGPVGIVISGAEQRAHIYRNGVMIGRVAIGVANPDEPLPPGVSTMLEGYADEPNPFAPDMPMPRWMSVALPSGVDHGDYHTEIVSRIKANPVIGKRVFELLHPGASLVVTNLPLGSETTTDRDFVIATSRVDEAEGR